MHRKKIPPQYLIICLIVFSNIFGQHNYQKDFPAEEFKQRWEAIFSEISDKSVVVVQGFPQPNGYTMPRQTNAFYYLSGVETPHSYILLDVAQKK